MISAPKLSKKYETIVLTGGGTAGHVIPHLAMLELYFKFDLKVHYIGSFHGIEKELLLNFPNVTYKAIQVGKLRRYFSLENFKDFFRVLYGFFQCLFYLYRIKPRFVFSKGGFVSVPVCWAAACLRIPVFTHESDYSPGLATKLILPFARKIFCAFESTAINLKKLNQKAEWVGIPIRSELYEGSRDIALKFCNWSLDTNTKPTLLVVGGSLGAIMINEAIRKNIDDLQKNFRVVHITGKSKQLDIKNSKDYVQFEFIKDEFKDVLSLADVIVSRSGATAIFEFLALKKLMLLIPLVRGSRGDQVENARFFKERHWAEVLKEEILEQDPTRLISCLETLMNNREEFLDAFERSWDAKFIGQTIFDKMLELS